MISPQDLTFEDWQEQYLRSRSRIISATSVSQGAIPRPPDLIEGFIVDKSLTLIVGDPFTGKSLSALAISISLATGIPFLGHSVVGGPRRVLYIGQDSASWDYAEQIRRLSLGIDSPPLDNLDLLLNQGFNITTDGALNTFNDYMEASHAEIVIMDTLASIHSADENSNRQMGAVMQILKYLRDHYNIAIFLIHHSSKPSLEERSLIHKSRGASVVSGSVDTQLQLSANKDGVRTLAFAKGRGVRRSNRTARSFSLTDEETYVRLIPTTLPDSSASLRDRILNGLPASRAELLSTIGPAPTALDYTLRKLLNEGLITKRERGVYECSSPSVKSGGTSSAPLSSPTNSGTSVFLSTPTSPPLTLASSGTSPTPTS